MELGSVYLKKNGFMGMITQHSWMFLSSYKRLRKRVINNCTIYNMVHLGPHAFEEIAGEVVQSVSFLFRNINILDYKGTYIRLVDWENPKEKEEKLLRTTENLNIKHVYTTKTKEFTKIPGIPIAYWANPNLIEAFEKGKPMNFIIEPKVGLQSGDNNRFLRLWYEVKFSMVNFQSESIRDSLSSKAKWFPYNKGGARRQWYGNYDYVVNWENDGFEIRNFKDAGGKVRFRPQNTDYYFRGAITWSLITNGGFSIRYRETGNIHDVAGMSAFINDHDKLMYLLGLMSTKISNYVFKLLNPTINLQVGDFNNFPVLFIEYKPIIKLVKTNIDISKQEWHSFETSWDFKTQPFLKHLDLGENHKLSNIFTIWETETEEAFNQLKANEEELNRIFIEIYGLQDELTPKVEDKDITISKAARERDIKSFISYAVGCMFGRCSLDEDSLIYAGGDFGDKFRFKNGCWEIKTEKGRKKSSIDIAEHNVIPIADGNYFEDDALERFVNFIELSFGKETLEENLEYIAETLGKKANETSRQAIRKYF